MVPEFHQIIHVKVGLNQMIHGMRPVELLSLSLLLLLLLSSSSKARSRRSQQCQAPIQHLSMCPLSLWHISWTALLMYKNDKWIFLPLSTSWSKSYFHHLCHFHPKYIVHMHMYRYIYMHLYKYTISPVFCSPT